MKLDKMNEAEQVFSQMESKELYKHSPLLHFFFLVMKLQLVMIHKDYISARELIPLVVEKLPPNMFLGFGMLYYSWAAKEVLKLMEHDFHETGVLPEKQPLFNSMRIILDKMWENSGIFKFGIGLGWLHFGTCFRLQTLGKPAAEASVLITKAFSCWKFCWKVAQKMQWVKMEANVTYIMGLYETNKQQKTKYFEISLKLYQQLKLQHMIQMIETEMRKITIEPELRKIEPELKKTVTELRTIEPELRKIEPELQKTEPEVRKIEPELQKIK